MLLEMFHNTYPHKYNNSLMPQRNC